MGSSLPSGKKPVGCKWVFTIKYKANGSIDSYKVRLVAKEYTQTRGIDYQETFAQVAKMNSVRILLSLAANLDWNLFQFDVKHVFLHRNLKEEVYMDYSKFKDALGRRVWGNPRTKHGIVVCQRKYVLDLLEETRMTKCKPFVTPLDPKHKLGAAIKGDSVDKDKYQRLVERLIYLSHTRSNIAYVVVSQFMHSPLKCHLEAIKRILSYLKATPSKGLFFKKIDHLLVEAYVDAD